ncbi:MAG: hypothetical protein N2319_04000 [Candidatus Kapabacteria bacterium]|nr:hypothetical protein [Candidatus Kapabacteria bacterium]
MKILMVRKESDVWYQRLKEFFNKEGYQVDLLDMWTYSLNKQTTNENFTIFRKNFLDKFPVFLLLKRLLAALLLLNKLENYYDVIHIFNIKRQNFWMVPKFRKLTKKLIISVYGGSTYKLKTKRFLFKRVFNYIDFFAFANPYMMEEFLGVYGKKYRERSLTLPMPVAFLDVIDRIMEKETPEESREKLGIDKDKITIVPTIVASITEPHIENFKAILGANLNPDKVFFLFQLTYGQSEDYKQKVISYIKENFNNFSYKIFDKFLSYEDLARLRISSDILTYIQPYDQLSSGMLETLYTGGILITGSWMPYKILKDLNISFFEINHISELPETLNYVIKNFNSLKEQYKSHYSILYKEYNINSIISNWVKLYN